MAEGFRIWLFTTVAWVQIQGQSMWELCWVKWHSDVYFPRTSVFPPLSVTHLSMPIWSLCPSLYMTIEVSTIWILFQEWGSMKEITLADSPSDASCWIEFQPEIHYHFHQATV